MNAIFWFPIGAVVLGIIFGAMVGARSTGSSARSGALIGLTLAFMATFPLMAIGLAGS